MQTIDERLDAIKEASVIVFVDSDESLVEYYMHRFTEKYKNEASQVVSVEPMALFNEVSSFGFFQQEKILKVMHWHEKDGEALKLELSSVRILIYASSLAAAKKISANCATCELVDNSQVKPWHRKAFLAGELMAFTALKGVQISQTCANYFVSRIGETFSHLMQEFRKVELLCNGGAVTREAIDSLTTKKSEENFFELSKQILFSKKVQCSALSDVSELFSLFVALRYQIYIALNLLNKTSDKATERVKGPQKEQFLNFIKGRENDDLLKILSGCFQVLVNVREHKIKISDALAHILIRVHSTQSLI